MIFSIIGAVALSAILALAMSYIGLGLSGSMMFGLFLALILPGILYKYLTTETEETTTNTSSGGVTTVSVTTRKPRTTELSAKWLVGSIYVVMLVAMWPVIISPIITPGDAISEAGEGWFRDLKTQIATAINPLSLEVNEERFERCKAEAGRINKEFGAALDTHESGRVPVTNIGYAEWSATNNRLLDDYTAKITETRDRMCPGVSMAKLTNGLVVDPTSNPFNNMGVYTALAVLVIVYLLIVMVFNLFARKMDLVGKNLKAIVVIVVVSLLLNAWWASTPMSKGSANSNPYAPKGGIVNRVLNHGGEKRDNCVNGEEFRFNRRWVNTGYVLQPNEKVLVKVFSSMYVDGMDAPLPKENKANGYEKAPANMRGSRMCDAAMGCNFLQIIGMANDPKVLVAIGDEAVIEANKLGTGPLLLSVDHVLLKPNHDLKANAEWALLLGGACWDIERV